MTRAGARVRVAILSFWHVHAKDYAAEAVAHPDVELFGVWDDDRPRGEAEAAARNLLFFDRLDDLLAQPDLDGVVVTTETTAHGRVIPAAAAAGKHVFTEKVIAPTRREAAAIVAETERAGVAFVVSLPRLGLGAVQAVKAALDEGTIGTPTLLRVRVGHDGAVATDRHPEGWLPARFYDPAAAAGGALIDLGAHPLYLARHLLGMPERVTAAYGSVTGRAVEDHAVVALHYPNGALALAEVSFVAHSPLTIEVDGTDGNLRFVRPQPTVHLRARTAEGALCDWADLPPLPADDPTPFAQWIDQINTGRRSPDHLRLAVDLTTLAEAANRSADEGRTIPLQP